MITVSYEQLHFVQIKTTTDESGGKKKKTDKTKKRGQGGTDKWELANDGSYDGYDELLVGFRARAQLFSVT